ncbi:hypothetical protein Dimus_003554 [Dionaea muscipula]
MSFSAMELVMPTESSELNGTCMVYSSTEGPASSSDHQSQTSSEGPVAILWDIENCPVPNDVRPEDVAGNIRMALRVHPVIKGAVTMFSAYGDFHAFPRRLREGCQRTGVKLIDVPNGRKDAADKAILVDMFLFALDHRPPSSIMLISGDVDFGPALHILGQRGYTVILAIPSGGYVCSALSSAGRFVWDWPSVARGQGFVPSTKPLIGCRFTEIAEGNEEEAIVYRGVSQSHYNSLDFSMFSQSLSRHNTSYLPYCNATSRSQCLPSGLNETTAIGASSNDQNESYRCFQPRNMNGLKGELVSLLVLFGGCLPLVCVVKEYQKLFGRPLFIQDYGSCKLLNLLKKMSDVMFVEGKGKRRSVHLRNFKAGSNAPPLLMTPKKGKKEEAQEENGDVNGGCGSSDEFSDDDRVAVEEDNEGKAREKSPCETGGTELLEFKQELQEILVSYSCRIFLSCFEAIYQQRYKRQLDYQRFGVNNLEDLFIKVRDVVVLDEESMTKRKFLTAIGC